MFLRFSFSVLLASLLLALTTSDVHALPIQRKRAGLVTLPLKHVESRTDVHPQILLQQHINRSKKRLAVMTGRQVPSEHEFRSSIEKRMFLLPDGPVPHPANLAIAEKRFNHSGTHRKERRFNHAGTHRKERRQPGNDDTQGRDGNDGQGHHGHNGQLQAAVQTVTVTVQATPTPAVGNPPAQGAIVGGATANAATPKNPGVTEIEIEALQNGGSTPADQPTASNSLGLEIFANDVGYLADVQIGTPPRTFKILMDSGSADFWVGAEGCVSDEGGGCGDKTFLGAQGSSSFVDTGDDFQVTYGTGSVSGSKITDNVVLAGLSLDTLQFGVAEKESVEFAGDGVVFDGLMGTAQSILANQDVLTPVEKLASEGTISAAITSYKLGRLADGKNDGEITFGGLDETKFDPATLVTLDNVSPIGFWEAPLEAVAVNGVDLGLQGRKAILDTGTTLILAPAADALAIHLGIEGAQSDGQGGFVVPCTTTAVISLSFGGRQFTLDPRDLAFAPVDINNPTGDCISGISSGNIGDETEWLVGDTFLKSVYFSHNVDTNQMSLANLK